MSKFRRHIAGLLCFLLLTTHLSTAALAADVPLNPSLGTPVTVEPAEAEIPAVPVNPAEPEAPTEPVTPAEPEAPSVPVNPAEPEAPTEPVTPAEPEAPTEPVTPAEPEAPSVPVGPAEPEAPTQPVEPEFLKEVYDFIYPSGVMAADRHTSLEELAMQLPNTVEAILTDGTEVTLPAVWVCESDDSALYAAAPDTTQFLTFWLSLPEGYTLYSAERDECDLPRIIVAFDYKKELLNEETDDRTLGAKRFTRVTGSSFAHNLIVDSTGKKYGTRRHHWFADDGSLAYCFAQGKADPDGSVNYQPIGYVDSSVAAIIDNGYPNTTHIGGQALTAEQAQQATQAAIWCYSNAYNKAHVTIGGMRAANGRTGSDATYAAAKWLVTTAASQGSDSKYAIYQPVNPGSGYQEVVSVYNEYTPPKPPTPSKPTTGTLEIKKVSSDPTLTENNAAYSLAGAQFGVYDSNGDIAATIVTGSDGCGQATLPIGTYTVKELVAPPGYKLSDQVYTVEIPDVARQGKDGCSLTWGYNGVLDMTQGGIYTGWQTVRFAVWKNADQSDLIWYDGHKINATAWSASANITAEGVYNIHAWGWDNNGGRQISTQKMTLKKSPTVEITVENPPALGHIEIIKTSTRPEETDGNPMFSLEGAVYGIYTDAACTNLKNQIITDPKGHGLSGDLPIGTYFVKEITPPKGYNLDSKIYKANMIQTTQLVSGNFTATWNTNGSLSMKISDVTEPYDMVRFAVWKNGDQSDIVWYDGDMISSTIWGTTAYQAYHSGDGRYNIHVYGWNGNTPHMLKAVTMVLDRQNPVIALNVQDEPNAGKIMLRKASAMPEITDGNSCYSLEGAVYGIYTDADCTAQVGSMTTNANGEAESPLLITGKYYVKEITPPKGYELDTTVYPVNVKAGVTIPINVKDMPGNDPVGITLTKIQETPNPYIPSMAGAEFTVKYYDGQYATTAELPEQPTRTWVIQTLERTMEDGSVIYRTYLSDEYKVGGDPFYYLPGNNPTVPIGTISIQETKAPDGYILSGGFMNDNTGNSVADENGVVLLHVLQDGIHGAGELSGGNYYTQKESFDLTHNLTLRKFDDTHTLLPGISFTLQIKHPETGEFEDLTTGVTDASGEIRFEKLVFGTYRLVETKTQDGLSLMPEPVEFVVNSDTHTEMQINIENEFVFELPRTGGIGIMPLLLVGAACMTGGIILREHTKRKKKT